MFIIRAVMTYVKRVNDISQERRPEGIGLPFREAVRFPRKPLSHTPWPWPSPSPLSPHHEPRPSVLCVLITPRDQLGTQGVAAGERGR
jgi:hypothetical protein